VFFIFCKPVAATQLQVAAASGAFGIANSAANAAFARQMVSRNNGSMASPAAANGTSNAVVTREEPQRATVPKSEPPMSYILAFGKAQYYVPHSAVLSYPKHPVDALKDGTELGSLLFTKAPASWEAHCHPDFLMHVQGTDGSTCVYATFAIPGFPQEQRFIRFIGDRIAEKNFEKMKDKLKDIIPSNERQRKRMAVLDWTKEKDCPARAQLNPELCGWTQLKGDGATEAPVESCRKDPESKKRVKGGGGNSNSKRKIKEEDDDDTDDHIKWQKTFEMGPEGSFNIAVVKDGDVRKVCLTQFKLSSDAKKEEEAEEE
jgi:hypothetical protein|tara:strand:+ start:1155 stop:2105 length:951 start_codon:yes stop_codon:yes gene_type:complete